MKTYKFYIDTGFAGSVHEWQLTEAELRAMMGIADDDDIDDDDIDEYLGEEVFTYINYGWDVE